MDKLYSCIYPAAMGSVTVRINDLPINCVYGDEHTLTEDEADLYSEFFELSDDWNKPLSSETIGLAGGAIPFTQTFENVEVDDFKLLKVVATVVGTMPAGATLNLDVYDAAGSVVEQREEILATVTNGTITTFLSGSYLNEAESYKVYGTVPQAVGATYDVTIEIDEVLSDVVKYVVINNNGMTAGVNGLSLQLKDADGDIDTKGLIKVAIASDSRGSFAVASVMNGIAAGTDGEVIEFADDQFIYVMSEDDGDIDLALTPTNAGTPTVNVLTIKGALVDGDLITFGTEVYEFTSGAVTAPTNIKVDITGLNSDGIAAELETTFNANTAYSVAAVDTVGTPTATELVISGLPTKNDFVTFGTEVYQFIDDGDPVTVPGYIKVATAGLINVTEVGDALELAFNTNTAYAVDCVNVAGTVSFVAEDLYTTYNTLATTDTEAAAVLAWPAATFGDGAGASTTGIDPLVTFTAIKNFVTYNSLATTDTEAGALIAFEDATFGGGAGASTTGVDPTSSWYLLVELQNGKKFVSQQLPYTM